MVTDIITETMKLDENKIVISKEIEEAMIGLRKYLFNTVYMNEAIKGSFDKAKKLIKELYQYFLENEQEFWMLYGKKPIDGETTERAICDFIAGMTDTYAINIYQKIFLPKKWQAE